MVAGLKFLSKKGFNPQNMSNQKRVWEARQEEKLEAKRLKERQDQLKRERDDEELAQARGESMQLKFMYQAPPGMTAGTTNNTSNNAGGDAAAAATAPAVATISLTEIQPGDDPAAAAFRRMLSAGIVDQGVDEVQQQNQQQQSSRSITFGTVLQGSSIERVDKDRKEAHANLSALEKSVGKRDANASLTLEEQIARFPQLKNAPKARGMSASDVNVAFKPLGAQLRNVRCLACGIWGHSRGERECTKSGWNPFAMTSTSSTTSVMQQDGPQVASNSAKNTFKADHGDQETKQQRRKRRSTSDSNDNSSRDSSSSSSDDDSYERRKRRKKSSRKRHRKHKKESRKKQKRRDVSSSSGDDSDDSHDEYERSRASRKKSKRSDTKHRHRRRYDSSDDDETSGRPKSSSPSKL